MSCDRLPCCGSIIAGERTWHKMDRSDRCPRCANRPDGVAMCWKCSADWIHQAITQLATNQEARNA